MNMRLYITGKDSAVRPYIGGGGAYSFGYLNYGTSTFVMGGNNLDYELTQFQGMLTGGLDFRLSKSISITAGYKFLRALSSTENESLNNAAFYVVSADATKTAARGSIRDSDVHEVLVGASFFF
jgi:outer membrane protein W